MSTTPYDVFFTINNPTDTAMTEGSVKLNSGSLIGELPPTIPAGSSSQSIQIGSSNESSDGAVTYTFNSTTLTFKFLRTSSEYSATAVPDSVFVEVSRYNPPIVSYTVNQE